MVHGAELNGEQAVTQSQARLLDRIRQQGEVRVSDLSPYECRSLWPLERDRLIAAEAKPGCRWCEIRRSAGIGTASYLYCQCMTIRPTQAVGDRA